MKAFFQSGGNPGSHFCKIDLIKNKFLKKGIVYMNLEGKWNNDTQHGSWVHPYLL